ncbi:MAG: CoA transferase, partial [Pirellulales bacterium]|nr:CoA transferase [Pirellulales bacterium]
IKVEPAGGVPARHTGPFVDDLPHPDRSLYFWHYNTSKRGITLNLDHPSGPALLQRLLDTADVLLDGELPGVLAARGLTYSALAARNPGLIYVSVTPFGWEGPWRDYAAGELIHLALGGEMASCGYDDPTAPPIAGGGGQAYHIAGNYAAQAEGITSDQLIDMLLAAVPTDRPYERPLA